MFLEKKTTEGVLFHSFKRFWDFSRFSESVQKIFCGAFSFRGWQSGSKGCRCKGFWTDFVGCLEVFWWFCRVFKGFLVVL